MKNFLREIKEKVLIYDGSKGIMLQNMGMKGGECPELWNVDQPEAVRNIYSMYRDAGSDVIQTNTFQGNRIVLEKYSLGDRTYELNFEGARLAREVMGKNGFVAASIGPIGILFEPSGGLTFEKAYETFKEQVKALADGGVDIINFETFTDLAELRAALLAAKEITSLPVICSVAFEANGKTLMGSDPYLAGFVLKSLGADMIGTNCSFGPKHMIEVVKKMGEVYGISLSVKPNAGLPELVDGKAVYKQLPEEFAEWSSEFVKYGARLIGGCCGTTPDFIRAVKEELIGIEPLKPSGKCEQLITSGVKILNLEKYNKLRLGYIDSRSDDELFKELTAGNIDFIVDRALELSSEEYEAIYVNTDNFKAGAGLLASVINAAQGYLKEPFIIETDSPEALSAALRIYKGKAGVVINGNTDGNMGDLLAAAKKYGSTIIDKGLV